MPLSSSDVLVMIVKPTSTEQPPCTQREREQEHAPLQEQID